MVSDRQEMSVERERGVEGRGGASSRLLKQSEQSTYLMCAPACVHARACVCVCVCVCGRHFISYNLVVRDVSLFQF